MLPLGAWLQRQESVHVRSIDLGLERIAAVARNLALGKPARTVITVAGTNGKGSTVAMLEQLVLEAGFSVGTFTSPHLFRYNERIRVNGQPASDATLIGAFERIEAARGDAPLTFFEYNTLAAFVIFAAATVDVAVLEVGLGGRLDAVNLIDADAAIVCSIGADHRDWLGDTLDAIGREKAGVFRRNSPAVLATADVPGSVYAAAAELGAPTVIAGRDYFWHQDLNGGGPRHWHYRGPGASYHALAQPALGGGVQVRNAAAAIAALESLGLAARLDATKISKALGRARIHGRFERIEEPGTGFEWIFDVAHNPPAAAILASSLALMPRVRTIAVAGILADKDAAAIARALERSIDEWVLCSLEGPRGMSANQLAERLQSVVAAPHLTGSVREACELARSMARSGERIVVFGSFHVVGPALELLGLY